MSLFFVYHFYNEKVNLKLELRSQAELEFQILMKSRALIGGSDEADGLFLVIRCSDVPESFSGAREGALMLDNSMTSRTIDKSSTRVPGNTTAARQQAAFRRGVYRLAQFLSK